MSTLANIFVFLLLGSFERKVNGRKLTGSLKWLGQSNQNSGSEFHPELDSVQVPVKVISDYGKSSVQIGTFTPTKNDFSLKKLIAEGHLPHRHGVTARNGTKDASNTRKCAEDIPEWNIYHRVLNETGKCHIPGKGENPCGKNMQFYLIEGESNFGDCDCKLYVGPTYRPLLYWAPTNQCFHLFEKGPCDSGQWLVLNSASIPVCEQRICPENIDASHPWILQNSTCHQLSTQAFCTGSGDKAQYDAYDMEPKCYNFTIKTKRTILNGAPKLPCKIGHKNFGSTNCQN